MDHQREAQHHTQENEEMYFEQLQELSGCKKTYTNLCTRTCPLSQIYHNNTVFLEPL